MNESQSIDFQGRLQKKQAEAVPRETTDDGAASEGVVDNSFAQRLQEKHAAEQEKAAEVTHRDKVAAEYKGEATNSPLLEKKMTPAELYEAANKILKDFPDELALQDNLVALGRNRGIPLQVLYEINPLWHIKKILEILRQNLPKVDADVIRENIQQFSGGKAGDCVMAHACAKEFVRRLTPEGFADRPTERQLHLEVNNEEKRLEEERRRHQHVVEYKEQEEQPPMVFQEEKDMTWNELYIVAQSIAGRFSSTEDILHYIEEGERRNPGQQSSVNPDTQLANIENKLNELRPKMPDESAGEIHKAIQGFWRGRNRDPILALACAEEFVRRVNLREAKAEGEPGGPRLVA